MKRRALVCAVGSIVLPGSRLVQAQTPIKAWRIGVVYASRSKDFSGDPLLTEALCTVGYEEGRNIVFERRFAEGDNGAHGPVPKLLQELVKQRVDLILTLDDRQASAAKVATSTIPIVMLHSDAPVEIGVVASLSRPGGNITGVTTTGVESAQKNLQLLHDAAPAARHLGVLMDPDYSVTHLYKRAYEQAATEMGCRLTVRYCHNKAALDTSLALMARDRVDAMMVSGEGAVYPNRARIIAFAAQHRLPAMYVHAQYVREGGLISRSPDEAERNRRIAAIIDRIVKGEKPADIAVEQPTRFNVAINLKTSRAMGLKIPQSVLLQTTEVIE